VPVRRYSRIAKATGKKNALPKQRIFQVTSVEPTLFQA
jgi:hypothetical protein